jgi:predicted aspartyl protease
MADTIGVTSLDQKPPICSIERLRALSVRSDLVRRQPVFAFMTVASVPFLFAASPHSQLSNTGVPLTLSDVGLVFIPASVDGAPVRALVDSGSFRTVQLSSTIVERLHLQTTESDRSSSRYEGGPQRMFKARVRSFTVGPLESTDLDAVVVPDDIERIATQVATAFDVVLGWGFLSRQAVMLDFASRTLRFNEPVPPRAPKFSWPYETKNGLPIINGEIEGKPTTWLFDTGAPICNLDPSLAVSQIGDRLQIAASVAGQNVSIQCRIKDLGPLRASTGVDGVIGMNLLREYAVRIDPAAHTVALY